jgi:hypothetical protein
MIYHIISAKYPGLVMAKEPTIKEFVSTLESWHRKQIRKGEIPHKKHVRRLTDLTNNFCKQQLEERNLEMQFRIFESSTQPKIEKPRGRT